ncbi:pilin [Pseudobacillus sp. 179-B 2D1 NHS]|uniref:pilin n=1 Tax=Pseudobacillus sp. 179-B 2D1 NHS TaxID=3374292 RepID=UPI0038795067
MDKLVSTFTGVAADVKTVAPPLAGLVLIIIGLIYMFAKDPQRKESCTSWMINVGVGFGLVYLGASLVTWLGTKVGAGGGF